MYLLYIYVNSDVTDTFTFELWFCSMHFLRLFSCVHSEIMFTIISFFQTLIKGGLEYERGEGLENFSKINKHGGTIIRYLRV